MDAAAETLKSLGSHRAPTYTKKAYTSVGLVFLPDERDSLEYNQKEIPDEVVE